MFSEICGISCYVLVAIAMPYDTEPLLLGEPLKPALEERSEPLTYQACVIRAAMRRVQLTEEYPAGTYIYSDCRRQWEFAQKNE